MSTTAGLNELSPVIALREMRAQLPLLLDWIKETRDTKTVATRKFWYAPAGTYVYHTTAVLGETAPDLLDTAAAVFAGANSLDAQPWYPAFIGGNLTTPELDFSMPFTSVAVGQARFDFGLGKERCYHQLIATIMPDSDTRVIALRSVADGDVPGDAVKAYTLGPTADLLQRHDDRILWHHIVTTGGAAVLPPVLDRWLMNALRLLGLDGRERQIYRDEAVAVHCMKRHEWVKLAIELSGDE